MHKLSISIALFLCSFVLVACASSDGTTIASASTESAAQTISIEEIEPLSPEESLPPVQLEIPELDLKIPVVPMGWKVVSVAGERTTKWEIPRAAAGWHVNTAGSGALGNTVISGHQVLGEAVFARLALGDVVVDQDILLTDEDGLVFVYRVSEVTDPIPLVGATKTEKEEAITYSQPSEESKLTLITGWPDFTTTHRIFVVADFVGLAN